MPRSLPYPIFLRFEGRPVLVVGGGEVALEKARSLASSGAHVRVVAPSVHPNLAALADTVDERAFVPSDLDAVWFVVAAATSDINRAVKVAAEARCLFVLAVDDPANGSAIGAAQLGRGGLTIAISSDGRAPALVALLRRALERVIPEDVESWVSLAERIRDEWKAEGVPMSERRPLLLRALNRLYDASGRPS